MEVPLKTMETNSMKELFMIVFTRLRRIAENFL